MQFSDSDLTNFVQAQANRVVRQASKDARYGITYPNFVPVDTSGSAFSPGTTFVSVNQAGRAGYINGNSDDVPLADASLSVTTASVYTQGIGYGWGYVEVNQARQYGFDLAAERALSARRAYEQELERLVFQGDSTHGLLGFKGLTSAVATSASNITAWVQGTTTAAQIAQDLIGLVKNTGQKGAPTANRILLDDGQYDIADTTFFANGGNLTALDYVKSKYPGMQIRGVDSLTNSSSKSLYIAYNRSPDVLSLVLPMPHRFLPVRNKGTLGFVVPGIFRTAGMNFKRKEDIAFAKAA